MCVEACPCDAIRMDTSVHPKVYGYRRDDFIEDKQMLMKRSRIMREEGVEVLMDRMLDEYREAEKTGELRLKSVQGSTTG